MVETSVFVARNPSRPVGGAASCTATLAAPLAIPASFPPVLAHSTPMFSGSKAWAIRKADKASGLFPPADIMRTDDSLSIAVWPANSSGVTAFEMLPALWWSSDANTAAENDPPEPTTYSGLPTAFLVNSSRPPIPAFSAHSYTPGIASSSLRNGLPIQ